MLDDYLTPTNRLFFNPGARKGSNGKMQFVGDDNQFTLHDNAIQHLATRFGVNARDLKREYSGELWEQRVFAERMNAYANNSSKKNVLIRTVDGRAKGILSDKYRRLNTAGIFMAFLESAAKAGSVLVDAAHGELRDYLEVVHSESN